MSLSYSAQFPYPVPDYRVSNNVYGQYGQALGPYPRLGGAGYGFPPGVEAGSMAAPHLLKAADNTVAFQYGVAINNPGQQWQFVAPEVKVINTDKAAELYEYLQQARSPSRLQTSTYGSVSMDNSGHVSYINMGGHSASYGRYTRSF